MAAHRARSGLYRALLAEHPCSVTIGKDAVYNRSVTNAFRLRSTRTRTFSFSPGKWPENSTSLNLSSSHRVSSRMVGIGTSDGCNRGWPASRSSISNCARSLSRFQISHLRHLPTQCIALAKCVDNLIIKLDQLRELLSRPVSWNRKHRARRMIYHLGFEPSRKIVWINPNHK